MKTKSKKIKYNGLFSIKAQKDIFKYITLPYIKAQLKMEDNLNLFKFGLKQKANKDGAPKQKEL